MVGTHPAMLCFMQTTNTQHASFLNPISVSQYRFAAYGRKNLVEVIQYALSLTFAQADDLAFALLCCGLSNIKDKQRTQLVVDVSRCELIDIAARHHIPLTTLGR
jgi:hypothetical protein